MANMSGRSGPDSTGDSGPWLVQLGDR